ncbi:hypothetical protein HanRHA438_Chr16g0748831 [Helianthus annuus]|nr:hypothetical protein HanIR_Chr16g0800661 [Helianthus annuus]KAJ0834893.1 hypothetical protein HanRHA438_Chr16g0748831 [Helianthus annuus]
MILCFRIKLSPDKLGYLVEVNCSSDETLKAGERCISVVCKM